MKQYLDLMQNILINGSWQDNRTGVRTKMLPGAMLKFDLREGFPAVTTKKLYYGAVVGELLGFLRGYDNAHEFNRLGCKVWDANSNAEAWIKSAHYRTHSLAFGFDNVEAVGYLGRIYGVQWRQWLTAHNEYLDQIANLIEQIKTNPTSRRLLVTAWRPDELHEMALPPCHYAFQIIIEQQSRTMHLLWNQRSCDMFLGVPFNIASYATLLHILAHVTGYQVGTLTGFLADVHIYENHLDQVCEQLSREPRPLPSLRISQRHGCTWSVDSIEPHDIRLENYTHHEPLSASMAV